jgi:hypothetical protein
MMQASATDACTARTPSRTQIPWSTPSSRPHTRFLQRGGSEDTIAGCPSSERGVLHECCVGALNRKNPEVYKEYETAQKSKRARVEADNWLAQLFKTEAAASAGTRAGTGDEADASASGKQAGSSGSAAPPPAAAMSFSSASAARAPSNDHPGSPLGLPAMIIQDHP